MALAILSVVGGAMMGLATDGGLLLRHVRGAEEDLRRASAFLDRVALWSSNDLDRHLGDRTETPWRLNIRRPEPTLYLVQLYDSTGRRLLLRTTLYRPDSLTTAAHASR